MRNRIYKALGFVAVLVVLVVLDQHMTTANPDVMQADIFWWIRKVAAALFG